MSFTVSDLEDLLRLLRVHPEWRDAVRHEVLTDDLVTLPSVVRELAQAQARTELRVEELAQAQARTELRVEELAQAQVRTELRVEELAQAQVRTERLLAELIEMQKRSDERLDRLEQLTGHLVADVSLIQGRMGNVEGALYEQRYRDHAPSRLGKRLRRVERVHLGQVEPLLDAVERGEISDAEWQDAAALDILVRGRAGKGPDAPERYFAIEVSITIDRRDVTRARDRAAILARAGLSVEACVAGQSIRPDAAESAEALGVTVLLDRTAA